MESTDHKQLCIIGRAIRDVPDAYRDVLVALVNGNRSADEVGARMRAAGLKSSSTSVKLHRRGQCLCQ